MSTEKIGGRSVELLRLGTGPPLLYLHGLADVHAVWPPEEPTALLHALAAEREVIAPALPGYLGSDALDACADVEDHAFHLADLLDALGLDTVDIVGCSFGGWLAAELALRHPGRVGRLALVDPLGLHARGEPGALFFGAVAPRGVGGYAEVRGVLFADPDSEIALAAFPDQPDRDRMLRWFTGLSGAAQVGWTAPQLRNPKLGPRLGRVRTPTLLVWGARDLIAPVAHGERWRDALPDARFEVVDDAAHCAQLEQPDQVARLVLEFLGS
jgi:pimeloyl-ACP methyl ester carboxylesterase